MKYQFHCRLIRANKLSRARVGGKRRKKKKKKKEALRRHAGKQGKRRSNDVRQLYTDNPKREGTITEQATRPLQVVGGKSNA